MSHALLSPSSAARWLRCPGSVELCKGVAGKGSEYASEGTRAHELAAAILRDVQYEDYDTDMLGYVEVYTNAIRESVADTGTLLIEQSVDISTWTGEAGAKGTADAIILHSNG